MLNVAVLMGRLVADPELRHTANDISVTSFTLAVDRSYVKAGSDRQTDFIDIVAWRSTADFVCKYFRKGQLVAVQGSIQTRTYTAVSYTHLNVPPPWYIRTILCSWMQALPPSG